MSASKTTPRVPLALVAVLALAGVVLVATAVPGVFTLDECNYEVTVAGLRAGSLTVPGTGGLTPSLELGFFDPGIGMRVPTSPIGATAPPLYAFLALPFSFFGWRGLMALQTLAWLGTGLLVFALAARGATRRSTPWIALGAYLLGGYGLEYAQAVWPHALAACLAVAGFALAARARGEGAAASAVLAGFVLGLATGVRYQNVVFAFGVGLGLLLQARRRVAVSALFIGGFLLPIAACSLINHARLGSWNPISKGPRYLSPGQGRTFAQMAIEAPKVLYAKVVDFTTHPVPADEAEYWRPDPRTGAVVMAGAMKKAWLQSAPWIALALGTLALAWLPRRDARVAPPDRPRELRAMSLPIACSLASFAVAGFIRHDGLCFNQRYFLELVPLAAVAFAWALETREPRAVPLAIGGAAGAALTAALVLGSPTDTALRQGVEMGAPLLLAGLLLLAFWRARGPRTAWAASALAAACVAWAAVVHAGEDVPASRRFRHGKLRTLREVASRLPPSRAALIAFGPWTDAFGPMLLERDLVIANASLDRGATLVPLAGDLLTTRRTFVLAYRMPRDMGEALSRAFTLREVPGTRPVPLLELTRR